MPTLRRSVVLIDWAAHYSGRPTVVVLSTSPPLFITGGDLGDFWPLLYTKRHIHDCGFLPTCCFFRRLRPPPAPRCRGCGGTATVCMYYCSSFDCLTFFKFTSLGKTAVTEGHEYFKPTADLKYDVSPNVYTPYLVLIFFYVHPQEETAV